MWHSVLNRLGITTYDKRLFGLLLLPSWISGLLCVLTGLGVALFVFIDSHYRGSFLQQQIDAWRVLNTQNDLSYYGGPNAFTLDGVFSNVVTFIVWGLIGLVLYLFVAAVVQLAREVRTTAQEAGFVHSSLGAVVRTAGLHLVLRAGILGLWVVYLRFFFRHIAITCLSWLSSIALQPATKTGVGHTLLAIVVIALSVHVAVILLRLLLLRVRVVHGELYVP